MASSIGFLLSLFFAVQIIAYVGDLTNVQIISSNLDSIASTAGEMISFDGDMSSRVIDYIEKNGAFIVTLFGDYPQIGELFTFQIGKKYNPIIMSNTAITLTSTKSVVIGYLD